MSLIQQIIWRYVTCDEPGRPADKAARDRVSALSRAVAREILRAHVDDQISDAAPIEIESRDAEGRGVRPSVTIGGRSLAGCLSISHTSRAVAAALSLEPGITVGIDLVENADLGAAFAKTWFDENEQTLIEGDVFGACRLWAIKEAVYKAANDGDSFAPRQVKVRIGDGGEYRITYRGIELDDRCELATWECDDHIVALAAVRSAFTCGAGEPPTAAGRRTQQLSLQPS